MFLDKYLNRKAFTALLVGSILAIMIGSVLLVVSYVVVNAIIGTNSAGMTTTGITDATKWNQTIALCASYTSNINNIVAALNIVGIALIVVGISGIIYMLIGLGGVGGGRK
jgi:hypothetical protein